MSTTVVTNEPAAIWDRACTLELYLASSKDATYRYVTFSTSAAVAASFCPITAVAKFKELYPQGSQFLLEIDGQPVVARVNRQTGDTIAFHQPVGCAMPSMGQKMKLNVVVVGPLPYKHVPKERKMRPRTAPPTLQNDATAPHPTSHPVAKSPFPPTPSEMQQLLELGNVPSTPKRAYVGDKDYPPAPTTAQQPCRLLIVSDSPIKLYKVA